MTTGPAYDARAFIVTRSLLVNESALLAVHPLCDAKDVLHPFYLDNHRLYYLRHLFYLPIVTVKGPVAAIRT